MHPAVTELDSTTFKDEVLKAEIPVVVEFYTPTCPYCKRLTPIFQDLASLYKGRLKFTMMDASAYPGVASGYGIMGVPTLKFFCSGRTVYEMVGFRSKKELIEEFEIILRKHSKCTSQSSPLYT